MRPLPAMANLSASLQNMQLNATERENINTQLRSGEAHQGGNPIGRRHSMDNGSPPLHLQQLVASLEEQVHQIRAKDDLDAVPGTFSCDLHQHILGQRRYEKVTNADFFDTQRWRRMRRSLLNKISGGGVVAAQYGLGFARDERTRKEPSGKLDIGHSMNGYYQRTSPSDTTNRLCHQLYQHCHPQALQQPRLFMNSEFMADKIIKIFRTQSAGQGTLKTEYLAPGVVAVSCISIEDREALEELVYQFGARPSMYQVVRSTVVARGQLPPIMNDSRVQNHLVVDALGSHLPQGILARLREVPESLGTSVLAHANADMIEHLTRILSRPQMAQTHQQNPLIAQGLQGIRFIADSMPSLATDSTRFGNAHRALMEEMQIVLGAMRPYTLNEFKAFASQRICEALPQQQAMKLCPVESFLFTSGMQALTEGMEIATVASRGGIAPLMNGDKLTQFYYEAEEYVDSLHNLMRVQNGTPAFYTSLSDSFVAHSSRPEHKWSVQDIVDGIGQQINLRKNKDEPLNVVIDTTIEKEGEIKVLMDKFGKALANNDLRLILCKSHQKFGNLGATKVLGGSLTLLGAKTTENKAMQGKFRHYETSQNWFSNDESQLLTHITCAAVKHEPKMLQRAIDNGNFIVKHCFNGENGHARFAGHDPDKPFSMLNTYDNKWEVRYPRFQFGANTDNELTVSYSPVEVIDNNFIRLRGSFGFTESNIDNLGRLPGYSGNMMRLSHGNENKPECIERHWMLSRERQLDRPKFTTGAALDLTKQLVNDALTPEQQHALKNKPLSDQLRQIGENEATPLSNKQRNQASVLALRAQAAFPEKFTLNKVASIIGYLNHLIHREDLVGDVADSEDHKALYDLLRGFIESGMHGVSRTGREQAVRLQCDLGLEDMLSYDPQKRRMGADNLIAALEKSNLSHSMVVLNKAVPDQAWQEMPQGIRDKLVDVIFNTLDVNSQLEFLHRNLQLSNRGQFTQECAMRLADKLKKISPGGTSQHWQATINQEMLRRGIIQPSK